MTDESEVLSREDGLVRGLPRFRWDSEEAVRYEVAVEALNRAIGAYSARMDAAEVSPDPDVALLNRLRAGMITCAEVRGRLDPTDHAAVDEVIRHYYALASELSAAILPQ